MQDNSTIRQALERNDKAVSLRPTVGQGTARTRATLGSSLSCTVEEGPWRLTVGMTEKYGGSNAGPNPGVLGRGALATCLAVGYGMWAARMDIPLDALEVEVQADYDVRGELGVDERVRPGYIAIRYTVTVDSPAPEADVRRMLDAADRYSSWADIIANGVPLSRTVRIASTKA